MKLKYFFIAVLFISTQLLSAGQKIIKTDIPCSNEVLFKTPGKWFVDYGGMLDNGSEYIPFNKAQVNETVKRMNAVRDMLIKIIPQPVGVDPAWHHSIGRGSFGEQVKYVKNSQGIMNREPLVEKPVATYAFICGFFDLACNPNNPNEIGRGYPGETDTWFTVGANGIGNVAPQINGSTANMLIDGYPAHLRHPVKEKFDGYELFYCKKNVFPGVSTNEWRMLFHRKGELPYIPVTRKQYIDQAIIYLTQFYDDAIKDFEQAPMRSIKEQETEKNQVVEKMKKDLAWNPTAMKTSIDNYLAEYKTEQEVRKEQVKNIVRDKEAVLKHYRDELEETTKQGLLSSPAIIPLIIYAAEPHEPLFVEENVGYMVVIENPKYMRKDLPKYVPQIMTVTMGFDEYWKPQADVAKLILENFPFDKLQAMIDK